MIRNLVAATKDFDSDKFLLFFDPTETLISYDLTEVNSILQQVENAAEAGKWAIGFVSYEASPAFDSILETKQDNGFPKICFCIFDNFEKVTLDFDKFCDDDNSKNCKDFYLGPWKSELTLKDYSHAVNNIKQQIIYGNSYQANFTFNLSSYFEGDPYSCFKALINKQKTEYSTFFRFDSYAICSASPELFFERTKQKILAKPMKGTARRENNPEIDQISASELQNSSKNQAENIMIVDLIRNDLSRIAENNSVETNSIFDLQATETVWQMTSTVSAQVNCSNHAVWQALFPCASISGAPKASTMRILKNAEISPRRVYTGAISLYSPLEEKQLRCSVAIRTVLIDLKNKSASYGVGSGITYDSDTESEYEECLLKAKVLPDMSHSFKILESILLTEESDYYLLNQHLIRLEKAAKYFNFKYDLTSIRQILITYAAKFKSDNNNKKHKVRLLLDYAGKTEIEAKQIKDFKLPLKLKLAKNAIDSQSIFVRFKTSNRHIYDQNSEQACDDTLLYNSDQQICESCIGNFVYKIGGAWFTPPEDNGLLAGIYRQELLNNKTIKERSIKIDQINEIEECAIINSVRGWLNAEIIN